MKYFFVFLVLFFGAGGFCPELSGAKSLPPENLPLLDMVGKAYYLATNLHVDQRLNKISSVNYLRGNLLPWGKKIRVERILRNRMLLVDSENGRRYSYEFHRNTRAVTSLKKHVGRILLNGSRLTALKSRVKGLSSIDQDGIYQGRALPGMSRQGLIIAIGYPPEFANRGDIMTSRSWHYWQGRWDKVKIIFDRRGNVAKVVD